MCLYHATQVAPRLDLIGAPRREHVACIGAIAKEAAEELTKAAQAAATEAQNPAEPAAVKADDESVSEPASPKPPAADPAAVAKKQLEDILTAGQRSSCSCMCS